MWQIKSFEKWHTGEKGKCNQWGDDDNEINGGVKANCDWQGGTEWHQWLKAVWIIALSTEHEIDTERNGLVCVPRLSFSLLSLKIRLNSTMAHAWIYHFGLFRQAFSTLDNFKQASSHSFHTATPSLLSCLLQLRQMPNWCENENKQKINKMSVQKRKFKIGKMIAYHDSSWLSGKM